MDKHAHYLKYRDYYIAKTRAYYKAHREEILRKCALKWRNRTEAEKERYRLQRKQRWDRRQRDKHREQQRKWRQSPLGQASRARSRQREREKIRANPALDQERHLRCTYGLTLQEFDDLLAQQGNKCAVCGAKKRRFVVDHDHETDTIRGILCWSCNTGIGYVERFARLKLNAKLAKYLRGGR